MFCLLSFNDCVSYFVTDSLFLLLHNQFLIKSLFSQPLLDSLGIPVQPACIETDGLAVLLHHPVCHWPGVVLEELLYLSSLFL